MQPDKIELRLTFLHSGSHPPEIGAEALVAEVDNGKAIIAGIGIYYGEGIWLDQEDARRVAGGEIYYAPIAKELPVEETV